MKAITIKNGKLICNRCGNKKQEFFIKISCRKCGICFYCLNCAWLGIVSMCDELSDTKEYNVKIPNNYYLTYNLTDAQKEISKKVLMATKRKEDILVWSVCGAGKTEIVYETIFYALKKGLKVCFTIPRREVVIEISSRLKKVFMENTVVSLYSGSKDQGKIGDIVVCTTHQLLKFQNCFDLIIIDEVDAFPFNIDLSLQYGLKRAIKKNGSIIYLSATPPFYLKKTKNKVLLPVRFHGFKLPLPKFSYVGNWEKNINRRILPRKLKKFIKKNKNPLLIFIPEIKYLEKITSLIKPFEKKVNFISSKTENRTAIINDFRSGKIKILVTTTILERGITLKGINICVLGSEHKIFSSSTLIQICGRVGRKRLSLWGNYLFS